METALIKAYRALAADMIEADGCLMGGIIDKVHNSGYVVDKDAAIGLSEATKREIIIHAADVRPQYFSPQCGSTNLLTAIQIAFFELGYYRAVVARREVMSALQSGNENLSCVKKSCGKLDNSRSRISLTLLHFNVRSIIRKFDQIEDELALFTPILFLLPRLCYHLI